jgi:maltose/moltooligosaccharide transporter
MAVLSMTPTADAQPSCAVMPSADLTVNAPAKRTNAQLLSMMVGIIGIQFAWSMQIALSSPVLEPLGANPQLLGLIWMAGPITGMLVQPLVGAWSDACRSPLGRRRPFILVGAVLAALSLAFFPLSPTLLVAALMIWVIDACVNMSQVPYRALIPDCVPSSQNQLANSMMNAAFGVGSVIALGVAPLLGLLGVPMTVHQQFLMASAAMVLTIGYSCSVIREPKLPMLMASEQSKPPSFFDGLKVLLAASPDVYKLCGVQFFTWIGVMCMFMYLTQFMIHNIYQLPDFSTALGKLALQAHPEWHALQSQAVTMTQVSLVAFNLTSLVLAVPLGLLANRWGRKRVHSLALLMMSAAFATAPWLTSGWHVVAMLGVAGVAWATILSIPFSLLFDYSPKGKEGVLIGAFNLFVASPQLLSASVVGYVIAHTPLVTALGQTHDWSLAFVVASVSVFIAALVLQTFNEKTSPANAMA